MKRIKDHVILVTGSTDGLGKKTVQDLAELRTTVLIHGRNPEKGRMVLREVQAGTGNGKLKYRSRSKKVHNLNRGMNCSLSDIPRKDICVQLAINDWTRQTMVRSVTKPSSKVAKECVKSNSESSSGSLSKS